MYIVLLDSHSKSLDRGTAAISVSQLRNSEFRELSDLAKVSLNRSMQSDSELRSDFKQGSL